MRIYVEGLTCSGKTTFLDTLKKCNDSINIIGEVPLEFHTYRGDKNNLCMKNDERKVALAQLAEKGSQLVLVDRSYVSTLGYNYVMYKQKLSNHYCTTLDWYMRGKQTGLLVPPDFFLMLKISPKVSEQRAQENNRYVASENPYIGEKFYEIFFDVLEPNVPILVLDGTLTHPELTSQLLNYIHEYHRKGNQP